jgi:prephenate dehydrogenase
VRRAGAHFIGSHPMAGSEKTGMAAARADLFEDAVCVVTPTRASNRDALRRVELFWRAVGARTVRMNPRHHDVLVGRSSHLPHLAAVTLANLVLRPGRPPAQADLCANGFRDTTRIASGSPEMWRDIMMANRGPLRRALDDYIGELRKLRQALKTADEKAVARHLDLAKRRRDDWRARSGSASSE